MAARSSGQLASVLFDFRKRSMTRQLERMGTNEPRAGRTQYCPSCGGWLAPPDDRISGGAARHCPSCGGWLAPPGDPSPVAPPRLGISSERVDPLLGTIIDRRFRIDQRIGDGAIGQVYQGLQLSVGRPVAIKLVRVELSHDRAAVERFLREARLLTSVNHPTIVNVYDYGRTETGSLYLVMEMIRGHTLAELLAASGRLDARRTCEIAYQLSDALATAHAHGAVHRDLKPSNIMLLDAIGDVVKVCDFGLAKSFLSDSTRLSSFAQASMIMGTPNYTAPEAIRGDESEPRSDLYSLGCILYELLTGASPFHDAEFNVVLARHLSDLPPRLPSSVPSPLAELIYQLLEKSPDQRPGTAIGVRTRLEALLDPQRTAAELFPELGDSSASQRPTLAEMPMFAERSAYAPAEAANPRPPSPETGRLAPAVARRARPGSSGANDAPDPHRSSITILLAALAASWIAIGWMLLK